jgi:hypothetical protein
MAALLAASLAGGMWLLLARRRRRDRDPVPHTAAAVTGGAVASAGTPAAPPLNQEKEKPKGRRKAAGAAAAVATAAKATPGDVPAPAITPVAASVPPAPVISAAAASAMAAELADEAHLPRWRRQSLAEARRSNPKVSAGLAPKMRYHEQAGDGVERAEVRYDLVRMTDVPDEITGAVVGELQAGDEIEIIERRGVWLFVGTPFGAQGWIHRTTIGPSVKTTTQTADEAPTDGPDAPPLLESLLATIVAGRNGDDGVDGTAGSEDGAELALSTPDADDGAVSPEVPAMDGSVATDQPTRSEPDRRGRPRRSPRPQAAG